MDNQSIKKAFQSESPYPINDKRIDELNSAVLRFIVKRHEPPSIVDDEDFVSLLSAFDNRLVFKLSGLN